MDAGDWAAVRAVVLDEVSLEVVGRDIGYRNSDQGNAVALDRLRRGLRTLAQLWGALPPDRPGQVVRAIPTPIHLAS